MLFTCSIAHFHHIRESFSFAHLSEGRNTFPFDKCEKIGTGERPLEPQDPFRFQTSQSRYHPIPIETWDFFYL